jgi:transcriptional regulator with XRE-family HTH domain
MDTTYINDMNIDQKESLAMRGDMGTEATRKRLIAARMVSGMRLQKEFAAACGVSQTTYNNMEKGLSFPSRDVMKYLYRAHRVDFNFIINGDFSQLPADVQDELFLKLSEL